MTKKVKKRAIKKKIVKKKSIVKKFTKKQFKVDIKFNVDKKKLQKELELIINTDKNTPTVFVTYKQKVQVREFEPVELSAGFTCKLNYKINKKAVEKKFKECWEIVVKQIESNIDDILKVNL